jgi:hypothetical protein
VWSAAPLLECGVDGAQSVCAVAEECAVTHAAAVPAMMKCIMANSASTPNERRAVM